MLDQAKLFFRLAFRNLIRHPRRTILTLVSIAFGLAVVLLVQSIITARNREMVETVTSTSSGHLQIIREGFLKNREIALHFPLLPEAVFSALPPGSHTGYRVYLPSLVSSGEHSSPVILSGVDPENESAITKLRASLVEGAFLVNEPDALCPSRQIYIGKPLAELLNVGIGDKTVILAQAADGSLGNDLFRVKGIFDTGSPAFDKSNVYAPLPCVQKVGAISGYHELTIRLSNHQLVDSPDVRQAIQRALPSGVMLTDWRKVAPLIAGMIGFGEAIVLMIMVMLFSVITVGIINTLFMSVSERTHEFGVMAALGVSPAQLLCVVFVECVTIALMAVAFGSLIGVGAVTYFHNAGLSLLPFMGERPDVSQFNLAYIVYPVLTFERYLRMAGLTVLTVTISGLYPAYLASRLNPIEAIHSAR